MIVALDSGIYISALQFDGVPEEALVYAAAHNELLTCSQIEVEVVRVMRDKFHRRPEEVRILLVHLARGARRVTVTGALSGICRDPNDDFILECAAKGHADAIVTGDKDLLSLGMYESIMMRTPRQYLDSSNT